MRIRASRATFPIAKNWVCPICVAFIHFCRSNRSILVCYAGCSSNSVCVVRGVATASCTCTNGFSGEKCTTPPSCDGTICNSGVLDGVAAGSCGSCVCPGFYSGPRCDTCSLVCSGLGVADSVPDGDCTVCSCRPGFEGTNCKCRYSDITFSLKLDITAYADTLLLLEAASDNEFRALGDLLLGDMIKSIPIGDNTLALNEKGSLSFTAPNVLEVRLRIKEDCNSLAPGTSGRRLSQTMISSSPAHKASFEVATAIKEQILDDTSVFRQSGILGR